jgi:hypothetical protein
MTALLAFVVTVACLSPLPDGSVGARWAVLSVGVPLLLCYAPTHCVMIALAVVAWPAVTLAWSPDPLVGVELWWHFLLLAAVVAIAPVNMRPVYLAIGIGLAINSAVVVQQLGGAEPVEHLAGMNATGLFFNKNQQNDFVALATIGLLSVGPVGWALAAVAALPLTVAPLSRAPLMALCSAGAAAAGRRWPLLIPAGVVLAAGLLLAFVGMPGRLVSNAQRAQTWLDMAGNLTFFGHGLGSFQWAYPEMEYAHSDMLQIVYELGAPGIAAMIAGICYILWSGPGIERLVVLAFMVEGLFDFVLYQPATGFLAALAAGHILRVRAGLRRPVPGLEFPGRQRQAQPRTA